MFGKKIVGIDIDIDSVKFVLLKKNKGNVDIEEYIIELVPRDAEDKYDFALKKIEEVLKKKRWNRYIVNIVIPTDDMQVRGIKIPEIPLNEVDIVVKREVKKIYGEIKDKQIAYQIIGKHKIDDNIMLNVFFALVPNDLIQRIYKLKSRVDNLDLKVFASERIIKKIVSKENNTLFIDLGCKNTLITIFKGENMELYREINIAGEEITNTIANILQVDFDTAEQLKIKYGIVTKDMAKILIETGEEPRANQLNFAYQVVLEKLIRKIIHSIDYFKNQNRGENINKCIITGGGSLLKGIKEFLSEELSGIEVDDFNLEKINIKEKIENSEKIISALGTGLLDSKVIKIEKKAESDKLKKLLKYKKYLLIIFGVLPFLLYFLFVQYNYLRAVNMEKKIDSDILKIAETTLEYDNYVNEIEFMNNNLGMFEQLHIMRYRIASFLYHLSDITLDNIYFSELNYDYNTKVVALKGESYSKDRYPEIYINDFVKNLEKEYYDVHLRGTRKTLDNVYSVSAFEIDMKISQAVVVKNEENNE